MDESFVCECGYGDFWFFGCFVRCWCCFNEYKHTGPKGRREFWVRRFNKETNEYSNWEHVKSHTFKEPDKDRQTEDEYFEKAP